MANCVVFKRKRKGGPKVQKKQVCFKRSESSPATKKAKRAAIARRGRIYGKDNLRQFACKASKTRKYPSLMKACRSRKLAA